MKIAILGFAGQGQSAYEYWGSGNNELVIHDRSLSVQVPAGAKVCLGEEYLSNLDRYDLIVRTPALHPRDIQAANPQSPKILDKVTSVTNEFFRVCPTKNIIGVTGTKGKGTTSTLITAMLKTAGMRVHLGGNIGIAPLELLKNNIKPDDWVVLELANFQLIDLHYSPPLAVCLMIEPEHLDWHITMDEYLDTKRQLFNKQVVRDKTVYYAANEYTSMVAQASPGQLIPFLSPPGADIVDEQFVIDGKKICSTSDIRLLGQHNWQNVCAAVTTVWQICPQPEPIRQAILAFEGLPHRLELVRQMQDVRYYNDSFASAPGATIAAMDAVEGSKIMIMGGFDRGLELKELAQAVVIHQADLRRVLLIGATAKKLETELKAHGFTNFERVMSKNMPDIVELAKKIAQPGDAVVLSPGFASFDMFKNFEDRGLQYKAAVNKLS